MTENKHLPEMIVVAKCDDGVLWNTMAQGAAKPSNFLVTAGDAALRRGQGTGGTTPHPVWGLEEVQRSTIVIF